MYLVLDHINIFYYSHSRRKLKTVVILFYLQHSVFIRFYNKIFSYVPSGILKRITESLASISDGKEHWLTNQKNCGQLPQLNS